MSIEISKPGDGIGRKARLSKTGRFIVGFAVVFLLAVVAFILVSGQAGKVKKEKEQALVTAIERGVVVCENSIGALHADDEAADTVRLFKKQIEEEKDTLKKADIVFDMIGFILELPQQDQAVTDELNGTRNRIFVALKIYKEATQ